jgi:hypothetical protein
VSGRPIELNYAFDPVPTRARRARRSGRLSAEAYDLVAYLYGETQRHVLAARGETPRRTLTQIAEGMPYAGELDSLRHLIRRTAESVDDWFDVRVEARSYWVFRLKPDEPSRLSDARPTSEAHSCPTTVSRESQERTRVAGVETGDVSDFGDPAAAQGCPTSDVACPTSASLGNGSANPQTGRHGRSPVRVLQKGQREHLLPEGKALGTSALGSDVPHSSDVADGRA